MQLELGLTISANAGFSLPANALNEQSERGSGAGSRAGVCFVCVLYQALM